MFASIFLSASSSVGCFHVLEHVIHRMVWFDLLRDEILGLLRLVRI